MGKEKDDLPASRAILALAWTPAVVFLFGPVALVGWLTWWATADSSTALRVLATVAVVVVFARAWSVLCTHLGKWLQKRGER